MKQKLEFNPKLHKYRINGVERQSVTEILKTVFTAVFYSETGANKGKEVHDDCQKYDEGLRLKQAFKHPEFVDQWILALLKLKLIKDTTELAFSRKEIEYSTFHPEYFYPGTFDRCKVKWFSIMILDIKTGGKNRPMHILQLHAYFKMVLDRLPLWRKLMIRKVRLINVYLSDKDHNIYIYKYKPEIFELFLAIQKVTELKDNPSLITRQYKGVL